MADLDQQTPSGLILIFLFDRASNFSRGPLWKEEAYSQAKINQECDIWASHEIYLENCNHNITNSPSFDINIVIIVASHIFMVIAINSILSYGENCLKMCICINTNSWPCIHEISITILLLFN